MLKALPEEIISAVADEESRATARAIEGAGQEIVIVENDDMMDFVIGGLGGRAAEASPASSSSSSAPPAPPAAPLRKAAERRVARDEAANREASYDLTVTEFRKASEVPKFHKASEHPNLLNDPPAKLNMSTELIQARRELKQLRASHVQVFSFLLKLILEICKSYSRGFADEHAAWPGREGEPRA